MGIAYLLDTNIISELERLEPNQRLRYQIDSYRTELALASVSWHELLYGFYRLPESRRKDRIQYFIDNILIMQVPILSFDADAAEWFARERARLTKIGRTPSFPDGQIAAIAATNNLTLVTRNTADFSDFMDLDLANWLQ